LHRIVWARKVILEAPAPICSTKAGPFHANIDTALVQQIFHILKQERESNVQHYRQADDLQTRSEIAKWGTFCHVPTLQNLPAPLKRLSSDKTCK